MAVRIIEYTTSPEGLSPADIQFGGVAGDHNATRLDFTLSEALKQSLEEKAAGQSVVYHFESYDSLGIRKVGDIAELGAEKPVFYLENTLTRSGGTVCVHLVLSAVAADETLMRLYSFPVYLKLISKQSGNLADGDDFEAIPTMAAMVKQRTDKALAAADSVAVAAAQTLSAATALSSGSEFIFLGGDAKSALSIELVVDEGLSSTSENPVKNSAVTNEIDAIKTAKQDKIDISELKAQIISACYPVGSYYWSESAVSPDTLFGGVWEQIKDRFVLACGDTYAVGDTGGKDKLRLCAAIGATQNDIFSLGYIAAATSAYQSGHLASYVLSCNEVSQTHKYWNHSVPVTEHESSEWDVDNKPPFIAAYCWKRIG